ncbi:MAG TPA: deoxyribonuclease IV [Anaerolineae bacterium]|nr:deoxyribonuclease IV [Anaerolineae bacterium]
MRLGAHMSAAGGVFNAFNRAAEVGCESFLVFTKSNRQWKAKPLSDKDISKWHKEATKHDNINSIAVHASYLINLASPKPDLWEKSYQALKVEWERAHALDIPYLTFHPGSHVSAGEQVGLDNIARALKRLLSEIDGAPIICLETMAGQGTNLGYKFSQLGYLLEHGDDNPGSGRLGVCFDTCHVFAAGYDIRTPQAYQATLDEFDRHVGLDYIKCFHFNDSKHGLGEQKDRHAHIGQGEIGAEGFANFINDPRWAEHPAHLETPKTEEDEDGQEIEMDPINLNLLKSLRQNNT